MPPKKKPTPKTKADVFASTIDKLFGGKTAVKLKKRRTELDKMISEANK